MSFRLMLNIRLAAWILAATLSTLFLPRVWHDFASAAMILVALIDRSLCRIAHAMGQMPNPAMRGDPRQSWAAEEAAHAAEAHAERRRAMTKRPGGVEV
jgi:hypothetical protein